MAVLSGKDGTLYAGDAEVTPLSNWKLSITADNPHYVANDTGGCKKRVAGARDSSGSFAVKAEEEGKCPVAEGDPVTLKLHVDATGNNYYEVPAIIDKIDVEVDVGEGRMVAFAVAFSGDGPVNTHGVVAKAT